MSMSLTLKCKTKELAYTDVLPLKDFINCCPFFSI